MNRSTADKKYGMPTLKESNAIFKAYYKKKKFKSYALFQRSGKVAKPEKPK